MTTTLAENMDALVGYSAYEVFKDFYERRGNGCYVAESHDSLYKYLIEKARPPENYRFEFVQLKKLGADFADTGGAYCFESKAMNRLQVNVLGIGLEYETDQHIDATDENPELFNVKIKGFALPDKIDKCLEDDLQRPYTVRLDEMRRSIKRYNIEGKKIEKLTKKKIPILLKSFEHSRGEYARDSVETAIALQDYITPYLIDVLKKTLADPAGRLEDGKGLTRLYALMLLGHFKERRAHKFIVDLFSLPGRIPESLFGDVIYEDLAVILLRTCGGSLDLIRPMVENKKVDVAIRASAAEAMVFSVAEGIAVREEVLVFLGAMFSGDEADRLSGFWDFLARRIIYLCPVELKETLENAYEEELIAPGFIPYDDFEEAFLEGQEKGMRALADRLRRRSMDDLHGFMSGRACFKKGKKSAAFFKDPKSAPGKKSTRKSKKRKRKMKKASKKRNRR